MDAEKLSRRWFLAAITYFVIGIGFGVYMGASDNRTLFTVHAHINLLGWASMGLTGLLYRSFPAAAQTRLAAWHFWLYQLAAPMMLLAVAALLSGIKGAEYFYISSLSYKTIVYKGMLMTEQLQPFSTAHEALQPSPASRSPSSQLSVPSRTELPQN